jgi:hypothetical protein
MFLAAETPPFCLWSGRVKVLVGFFPNHQLLSRLLDNFPVCNFNNHQGKYKNHRDNIYFLGVIGNLLR